MLVETEGGKDYTRLYYIILYIIYYMVLPSASKFGFELSNRSIIGTLPKPHLQPII